MTRPRKQVLTPPDPPAQAVVAARAELTEDVLPLYLLGPAMRALEDHERRFVMMLVKFSGRIGDAAEAAGIPAASGSAIHRMQKVKEAILEEATRLMATSALLATATVVELASSANTDNKTRLKAAEMILNRTGLHEIMESKLTITKKVSDEDLVETVIAIAKRNGMDPKLLLGPAAERLTSKVSVIEGEFEEVEEW